MSLNDITIILTSPPLLKNTVFFAYSEWHCYDTQYKNDFLDYLTNNMQSQEVIRRSSIHMGFPSPWCRVKLQKRWL